MSWKACAYVKEITKGIKAPEKFLLLLLAEYHNTAQQVAWPSIPQLAEDALISERQARRTIASLEEKKFIRRVRPTGGHETTYYEILGLVQNLSEKLVETGKQGGQNVLPKKSRVDIREDIQGRAIRKEPVIEPVKSKICSLCNGTRLLKSQLQPGRMRDCECVR